MPSDPPAHPFSRAHAASTQQRGRTLAVQDRQVLRRVEPVAVTLPQWLEAFLRIVDGARNRRAGARRLQNDQGQAGYGEAFALVDAEGVGLYGRAREVGGGDDAPSYTHLQVCSLGLEGCVLEAELALLDDLSLAPIRTLDIVTLELGGAFDAAQLEAVHTLIAREGLRLGYRSERHPWLVEVDRLWQLPRWTADPAWPLRRQTLSRAAGLEPLSVEQALAALAQVHALLAEGRALDPQPVQRSGRPGLDHDFALRGGGAQGWVFALNWVDVPERQPQDPLQFYGHAVGLDGLFVSLLNLFSLADGAAPARTRVEAGFLVQVTTAPGDPRLERALPAFVQAFGALGYAPGELSEGLAGRYPD